MSTALFARLLACESTAASGTGAPRSLRALGSDTRGAVMLTGLFMSCFLIGALWFLIGIGDAIIFREKMQEAADTGAFASAALQAKGMNFISLCNLLILAAVTIHIIMGVISDIYLAMAIISCSSFDYGGCAAKTAVWQAWLQLWNQYFNAMKPAAQAVHKAQVIAGVAYPAMGLVEAGQLGRKYTSQTGTKPNVLALSGSLIPGAGPIMSKMKKSKGGGMPAGGGGGGGGGGGKMGLPLDEKPFSFFCDKIGKVGTNIIFGAINIAVTNEVLQMVKGMIGESLTVRYCNKQTDGIDPGMKKFWGEEGAMVVYGAADNGNPWFQTWALNINPKLDDVSESKVGIAAKKFEKYTKEEKPGMYFAQAEMYFDCDKKWREEGCNFEDNATFQVKWRARLRRLEAPAIATGLVGTGLEALLGNSTYKDFRNLEGKFGEQVNSWLKDKAFAQTQVRGLMKSVSTMIETEMRKAAGALGDRYDPKFGGVYH